MTKGLRQLTVIWEQASDPKALCIFLMSVAKADPAMQKKSRVVRIIWVLNSFMLFLLRLCMYTQNEAVKVCKKRLKTIYKFRSENLDRSLIPLSRPALITQFDQWELPK